METETNRNTKNGSKQAFSNLVTREVRLSLNSAGLSDRHRQILNVEMSYWGSFQPGFTGLRSQFAIVTQGGMNVKTVPGVVTGGGGGGA